MTPGSTLPDPQGRSPPEQLTLDLDHRLEDDDLDWHTWITSLPPLRGDQEPSPVTTTEQDTGGHQRGWTRQRDRT